MGPVFVQGQWIDDTAAGECEPRLTPEEGVILRAADTQGMRPAIEEPRGKQSSNIRWVHRTIGDTAQRRLDLHERFEPEKTSRAVANECDFNSAGVRRFGDRTSNPIGANRNCC